MQKEKVTEYLKLISGRVCLTFTCAIGFLMLIYTLCQIMLQNASNMTFDNINSLINIFVIIISNVMTFYFTKKSDKQC